MALTQAKLPAPLRLQARSQAPLSNRDAATHLSNFLADPEVAALLSGSGVVRASIVRLVQGLNDELASAPPAPTGAAGAAPKNEDAAGAASPGKKSKKDKKRKGDKAALEGSEGKKRRKVEA
ncbi:uncharacterized protein JCM10292_004425 [Rhodotorula paludigena]|uniref:uncharacterized protein n=1 Tax=Rhodotorula paludigena TaxID=86838 RepID=UPI0031781429